MHWSSGGAIDVKYLFNILNTKHVKFYDHYVMLFCSKISCLLSFLRLSSPLTTDDAADDADAV